MIEGQGELAPRRCPRCGGLMFKPTGSLYYWHADYNHPPCDITNIVDPPLIAQALDEPVEEGEPPKNKRQRK